MRGIRDNWLACLLLFSSALLVLFYNLGGIVEVVPAMNNPLDMEYDTIENGQVFFLREAMFYEKLEGDKVQCNLCFRNCIIAPDERGFCRNRENQGGILYNMVYGRPSAVHVDPVEKEPLFHFHPGSKIYCIGTAGCNFRCKFCHNWSLSQRTIEEIGYFRELVPQNVIDEVSRMGIPAISFTYNEPTSLYEYMYDVARLASKNDIKVVFHSNGSLSPEALTTLLPYVDAVTIDLKGFCPDYYERIAGAELEPVLETLKIIGETDVWLEIVNLIVPGLNDDPTKIRAMCQWIYEELGPNVPLHFTRFSPAYRLTDLSMTPISTLELAYGIAKTEGINYVNIGNYPGHDKNSTFCHECGQRVVARHHFSVFEVNVTEGRCDFCQTRLPGVWE